MRHDELKVLSDSGAVYINRIRSVLVLLYVLAIIASFNRNSTLQNVLYFIATGGMALYSIGFYFWHARSPIPRKIAKVLVVLDLLLVIMTMIGGSLTVDAAQGTLRSPLLYLIIVMIIVYSAYLLDPAFTASITILGALGSVGLTAAAHFAGIQFTWDAEQALERGYSPCSTEISRFLFLLASGMVTRVILRLAQRALGVAHALNDGLESQVLERTSQLSESLESLKALKHQQDADYFLTSLLLNPLGGIFAKTNAAELDAWLKQKKSFHYRQWEASLGGDLVAAYNIRLRGQPYVAFISGDCMGKSLQGAGGALVLGTVFKSIVSRTALAVSQQQRYPEQWLKSCFLDLQTVFETFDGSMVTSATIGLLDEQRAVLYYTNAEHPWTVLYRDGQARFLEQETRLRRIGFPWIEDLFYLHVTRLESGDTVIFGSDGRDDLILGKDKNNDYIINTDENLFLQSVEQAHGKLEPLSNVLSGIGDFVDDVSLLRIAIPDGHGPETFQKTRNPDVRFIPPDQLSVEAKRLEDAGGIQSGDPAHVRSLFTIYQRMGDPRAADAILRYSDLRPESNSVLLGAVRILKNHGRFAEAVDASERLRLRDRKLVRNLEILARLHRTLGNTDRERTILLEVDGLRRSLRGQT
ncbi:MAG: serine/threonine-protein phosphatase [Leptospiraceae bacterium]|nr:serine/threonine-protein phosphatase [Leptospiraceae bacterium]